MTSSSLHVVLPHCLIVFPNCTGDVFLHNGFIFQLSQHKGEGMRWVGHAMVHSCTGMEYWFWFLTFASVGATSSFKESAL